MQRPWTMPSTRAAQTVAAAYVLLATAYLVLATLLPISILAGAMHDDGWFITKAQKIVSGHWFGGYDQMTLIKGPAYPFLLALNHFLGVPVTLGQALVYLAACALAVRVMRSLGLRPWLALVVFAVLLFHPALFPTRVVREGIYAALTLLSLVGVAAVALRPDSRSRPRALALYGLAAGLFWTTREEGVWLLPALLVLIGFGLFARRSDRAGLRAYGRDLAVLGLWSVLLPTLFALVNYVRYDLFLTVDIKEPGYVAALNRLNDIDVGSEIARVPVPRAKRRAAYAVSPAFRELEAYFEDPENKWRIPGCNADPQSCGDYGGGWFLWALRDGVSQLGHYETAATAATFYRRIADEIEVACRDGRLSCRPRLVSFLPQLPADWTAALPDKVQGAVGVTLYQQGVVFGAPLSMPSADRVAAARDFLGRPRITPLDGPKTLAVAGWLHRADGRWFVLECGSATGNVRRDVARRPAPPQAAGLAGTASGVHGFTFEVAVADDCRIVFDDAWQAPLRLNDLIVRKARAISADDGTLRITRRTSGDPMAESAIVMDVKRVLIGLYHALMPVLAGVGVIAFAVGWGLVFAGRVARPQLLVLASAAWCAYLSRIGLIVLVDISSFGAIVSRYLEPAFPLLTVASLAGIAFVIDAVRRPRAMAIDA